MKKITLLLCVFSALLLLTSCGEKSNDVTDSHTGNINIITDYALQDKICLDTGEYTQINGFQLMDEGFYIGVHFYEEETALFGRHYLFIHWKAFCSMKRKFP